MKRHLIILLIVFMGCEVNEPITEITEEDLFTCPDGLTIPSGVVGTVANPFQGDILIDQSKQAGVTTELWDNKVVPIYFDERWSEDEKDFIRNSLYQYRSNGFTFPELTEAEAFAKFPIDHIFIKYSGIANSYIGKNGGQQEMYLPYNWLTEGTIIHEFGHAVGLHHPHVTDKQSEWLTIYCDNIQEDKKFFFRTYTEYETGSTSQKEGFEYGDSYDIYSVMNYPSNAFAIDQSKPTMTLKDGTWFEGGELLSEGDIISINRMYKCYKFR